ncbi:MAG: endonuclease/exonuclease/phosphatase family protein [Proteobacteria bacterium]|nr:endonuclease/exonuclease/phosphatase family protein [Pseudomonadota bacterium]
MIPFIAVLVSIVWVCGVDAADNLQFRIATYNVENLFDLENQGTEYTEYIPGGSSGWGPDIAHIKYNHMSQVLSDLKADLVALQEVESEGALIRLQDQLKERGMIYPHRAFLKAGKQAVGCALFSRFPIRRQSGIPVRHGRGRSILKVEVDVKGTPLLLYINHWQSKKNPESARMDYARALEQDMGSLKPHCDFVVLGDFNSDYDEYRTFLNNRFLNDTNGETGINHVLGTVRLSQAITEKKLVEPGCERCLFDLWLEFPIGDRWSYLFFGRKGSLDHILVPASLYDGRGINYLAYSFKRFMPEYVFQGKSLNRWQLTDRGHGRHLGIGYSDHLPLYADFTTQIN